MKRFSSLFIGLILVIVGVVYFGNSFDFWNIDIFFDGWWTLFIIVPSICGLFKKQFISSFLGISIGVLLLLGARDIIEWSAVGKAFTPLVLVVIGLSLVFKTKNNAVTYNDKGLPEYVGIFSGHENKVSDKFDGANVVAVFGGVDLDLTNAIIDKDIVINCVSVFGGVEIKLPSNVKVVTDGVPIFGGMENKFISSEGPTVVIKFVCVFGGVDVN